MTMRYPTRADGKVYFQPPRAGEPWPHASRWGWAEWHCWLSQQGWSDDRIRDYVHDARYKYGFGLRRSPRDPWTWFYLPTPKQVEMHACRHPNVGYGGAAGGSKSHGSRWDAYRHCWSVPGFRAIIMRRTFKELEKNHMDRCSTEAMKINHFLTGNPERGPMDFSPSNFECRFTHNGSKIIYAHCQNPGDEERYLSDEYDAFYPDEVATFLQTQVLGVASRLRSVIEGVDPRMVATTNPAGAHTLWFVDWFINHQVDLDLYPDYEAKEWYFIQSLLYDNPWLMDKDGTFTRYIRRLGTFSPLRRKQMIEGDWTALTGQYFTEFSHPARFIHIPYSELRYCRIERWIDWGYAKPGVCYWVAIFPSGHVHTFHEYKFQDTIAPIVAKTVADETADLLRRIHGDSGEKRISRSIGDPSMFNKDGHNIESYSQIFQRYGVSLIEGDNQRILGWGRMRSWMAFDPHGRLWWTLDPSTCPYAVRSIGSLIRDKSDEEDLDTNGEDHPADAHRYGFVERPSPDTIVVPKTPPLTDSVKALLNSLQQAEQFRLPGMVA